MKFTLKEDGKRILVVVFASLLMAINIKTFVRTGGLYPGGATGLTILIQRIGKLVLGFEPAYSPINILCNAIPVYIGFKFIGKKFTLYSLIMILLTGFFTDMLPAHVITYDTLLIAIFGGMINGLCISLCLSVDATSGGTDFISIYLSQKKGMETWNIILLFNVLILSAAGFMFGWDKALYSIVFQYVSTQTLHNLYHDFQRQTLFIVTEKAQEVSNAISDVCHHGATIMDGEGSYQHHKSKVVYSVICASDTQKALRRIMEVDPKAFINSIRTDALKGHFYIRPKD